MDPKPRQLRAFVAAYRLRSLTQAGEQLHLTQSAVSQLTQQLEEVVGVRLFDRTPRALRPTEAADAAIELVERILADTEQLKTRMRGFAESRQGTVTFACTPSFAATVAPPVLKAFKNLHPEVKTVMHDAAPDKVMELVMHESVDFGILMRIEERTDAEYRLLHTDSINVIFHAESPLAQLEQIRWKDLAGEKVIAIDGGSGLPSLIKKTLEAQGEAFAPSYGFSYLQTAVAMAAQGLGVLLLPGYLAQGFPPGTPLIARQLVEPVVPRHLYLISKHGRSVSPAAESLVTALAESLD
jgi:DNA-binding transcriptional LysR family regulator